MSARGSAAPEPVSSPDSSFALSVSGFSSPLVLPNGLDFGGLNENPAPAVLNGDPVFPNNPADVDDDDDPEAEPKLVPPPNTLCGVPNPDVVVLSAAVEFEAPPNKGVVLDADSVLPKVNLDPDVVSPPFFSDAPPKVNGFAEGLDVVSGPINRDGFTADVEDGKEKGLGEALLDGVDAPEGKGDAPVVVAPKVGLNPPVLVEGIDVLAGGKEAPPKPANDVGGTGGFSGALAGALVLEELVMPLVGGAEEVLRFVSYSF